jgi:acyl transferase domain-containing protein
MLSLLQVSISHRTPEVLHASGGLSVLSGCDDAIGLVPLPRWDVEAPDATRQMDRPTQLRVHFGGFLADVVLFDAAAFQISSAEAQLMDPQQRLMLEVRQDGVQVDWRRMFVFTKMARFVE